MLGHSQCGPWLSSWFLKISTFSSWNVGSTHTCLLPLPYAGNEKASVLRCSTSSPFPKGWSGMNGGCHKSQVQDSGRICLWDVLANYMCLMSSSSISTPLGCRAPQTCVCGRGRVRRDGAVRWRLQRLLLPVPLMNKGRRIRALWSHWTTLGELAREWMSSYLSFKYDCLEFPGCLIFCRIIIQVC